ncbi:MAG: N-acetyl-gamma-glutamyl-phosphate reductase [Gammaproteobacteria bacterium]|nr:N-acetyl-gamma-glutamyl-phosphate reductase [Gammaproteobacteria bacterium]
MSSSSLSVGIIGARGYVGAELLRLIDRHRLFRLVFASSRSLDGQGVSRVIPGIHSDIRFEHLAPQVVAERKADVLVLALPNGLAAGYVSALPAEQVVIDLSADYRFDDTWYYGLPELTRAHASGKTRISNPGCYATAMQLALAPVVDRLETFPVCFGISGYSGAGTAPSDKNDPKNLADNIIPYKSVAHIHEREVSRQLGRPVRFLPNVAAFFRGIAMTVDMTLTDALTAQEALDHYQRFYEDEALISVQMEAPHVNRVVNRPGAMVGGFCVEPERRRLVVHSTLDNLLKGAATQALQNINLACGLEELEGIDIG